MIKLSDYFSPVSKQLIKEHKGNKGFLGSSIKFVTKEKELSNVQLVLFSVSETRNAGIKQELANHDEVRNYIYKLKDLNGLDVADLGELKLGRKVKDTYISLQQVVSTFISLNIIPIVIGGSHELSVPIGKSFIESNIDLEQCFVDAKVDLAHNRDFHSFGFIQDAISIDAKRVKSSFLAHQSYFVSDKQIDLLQESGADIFRLGVVRQSFELIEPVLRDTNFVSFDLSAIRQSDSSGVAFRSPNGLYAEEACQLMHLAGISDKLACLGLFEYNQLMDSSEQTAHLMAQLIWHFLLGVNERQNDYPKSSLEHYKKIFVKLDRLDYDLVFYKNEDNNRFWVEIPNGTSGKADIIACAESDYYLISNNEIPDRIWKRISFDLK